MCLAQGHNTVTPVRFKPKLIYGEAFSDLGKGWVSLNISQFSEKSGQDNHFLIVSLKNTQTEFKNILFFFKETNDIIIFRVGR